MLFCLLYMIQPLNKVGFKYIKKNYNMVITGPDENLEVPSYGRFESARLIQKRKSKIMGLL